MANTKREAALKFKMEETEQFLSQVREIEGALIRVRALAGDVGTGGSAGAASIGASGGLIGGGSFIPAGSGATFAAGSDPAMPLAAPPGGSPQQQLVGGVSSGVPYGWRMTSAGVMVPSGYGGGHAGHAQQGGTLPVGTTPAMPALPPPTTSGMGATGKPAVDGPIDAQFRVLGGGARSILGNILPGDLGVMGRMMGAGAALAVPTYLAGRYLQTQWDVGVERAVTHQSGALITPEMEAQWRSRARLGWLPFVGEPLNRWVGARATLEGQISTIDEHIALTGGDSSIRSMIYPRRVNRLLMGATGWNVNPVNGARDRLRGLDSALSLNPALGMVDGGADAALGEIFDLFKGMRYGAPLLQQEMADRWREPQFGMARINATLRTLSGKASGYLGDQELETMREYFRATGDTHGWATVRKAIVARKVGMASRLPTREYLDRVGAWDDPAYPNAMNVIPHGEGHKSEAATTASVARLGGIQEGRLAWAGYRMSRASELEARGIDGEVPFNERGRAMGQMALAIEKQHQIVAVAAREYEAHPGNYALWTNLANARTKYEKMMTDRLALGNERAMAYLTSQSEQWRSYAGVEELEGRSPEKGMLGEARLYRDVLAQPEAYYGRGLSDRQRWAMEQKARGLEVGGWQAGHRWQQSVFSAGSSTWQSELQGMLTTGKTGPELGKALENVEANVKARLDDVNKMIDEAITKGLGAGVTAPLAAESAGLRSQLAGLAIQKITLPLEQAMRVSGAYAGGYGTVAGVQTMMMGSRVAVGAGLQSVAQLEQTAASAVEKYQQLKASGAGPAVVAQAWQEAAQAQGVVAQSRMGLAQYQPSPGLSERLGQAEFAQSVLTRTFGSRGSVRAMARERAGALDEMSRDLMRQMQTVLPTIPPEQRPAVEHAFRQQLRDIQLQQVSVQQELEQGWMERLVSANWNAPGTASLVENEFNYAGAVMRHGIKARHMGATSDDLLRYQRQPLGAFSYGGAGKFGTPLGFASSALSGVTDMPMSSAPGAAVAPPAAGGSTIRVEVIVRSADGKQLGVGEGLVQQKDLVVMQNYAPMRVTAQMA